MNSIRTNIIIWTGPGIIFMVLIMALPFRSFAANGTISGRVTDATTNEGLGWASVKIVNTPQGSTTDREGYYSLNLPAGSYTLRASYLGYKESEKTVIVKDNENIVLNFELLYSSLSADTVVISMQISGQLAAINEQLASNKIVNVVSAEKNGRVARCKRR